MLPNTYKWKIKKTNRDVDLIESILNNRGICGKEEIERFLKPTKEALHSPYLLNDMQKAVDRIVQTKEAEKHIVIYGDYDVDGITSTSILYMFLKRCGYRVSYYIPDRQTEGYGLNKDALEQISSYSDLVITVDTGIAAVEELVFANSIGLDVIITDHHECQEQLPKGYCIINPKRKDSTYPFEALAGVGVTFKLIHALAIHYGIEEAIWDYIDLVALGTIADVVPLIHENRALTYMGFQAMQNTYNMGLKELIRCVNEGDANKQVTSNMIAYQIGPRINAAGRLSDAKIGVELLTTQDKGRAEVLAALLNDENKKRQEMEASIIEQAEAYIESSIDKQAEKVFIIAGKEWHHGVIGIVASKIMGKYYRPTIVLTEEDGVLSGSARSIEGFNIFEAINDTKEYLLRFGGHEMAAGLSLKAEDFGAFKKAVQAYAEPLIDEEMLVPAMDIDLDVDVKHLNLDFCEGLEQLEPFGAYNPMPVLSITANVQYAQRMGKDHNHLKLILEKDNIVIQAIGFYKGYLADYLTAGETVVIGGEVTKNVWNNKTSIQLRIKDIKSTEEVILKSKYYMSLYTYLKNPSEIKQTHIPVKKILTDSAGPKVMNVYTEAALNKFHEEMKNNAENINLHLKICYNKVCVKNNRTVVCVNPIKKHSGSQDYEWDYQTINETFEAQSTLLNAHKAQLIKMIPSHRDCVEVYKLLKNNILDSLSIHKVVITLAMYDMTEYKLFQTLEIFKELNILQYDIAEDKIKYNLIASGKTKLETSDRYAALQKFSKVLVQIN
jgi:single-stranded-DNA-specific exonuclease